MKLTHLQALEAEAIHVMREVAAELERPVLLFSGGKDSIVLLRLAEKAFRPGALPVPAHARRHRAQLPRGHRVPRPARGRAGRAPDRRQRAGVDRRADGWSRRPARAPRATACRRRRCSTRSPSTASTPRSAARGATRSARGPRSASSRSATTSGGWDPKAPAPRAVEPLQRAHPPRRARARVPALQLDRARRVAVHRRRGPRGAVDLLRPRARGLPPRRDALRGLAARELIDGEEPFAACVRYRTVGDMSCTGAVRSTAATLRGRRRRDRRHARSPSAARRAPTTACRRPRWRTARWPATSDGAPRDGSFERSPAPRHRRLGRRRQVDAHRAAAARRQGDPRRPARRPARPRRRARPRAADRRPARRARAGHHDRRRLPLLRHRAAHVHPGRHARARAVHAQHGHRRLDRRPGDRPRRRAQRRGRADAPPRLHRLAARHPAPRGGGQQDGPRRLVRGRLRRRRARLVHVPRPAVVGARHRLRADERAARRQRRRALRAHALVRRPAAARAPGDRPVEADRDLDELRFPVQYVIRDGEQRLPRLRRPARRRRAAARRRGRRAARPGA